MKTLIDSKQLLEAVKPIDIKNSTRYIKRKLVFIICPDPFITKGNPMEILRMGYKAANDSGKRNESPLLCYSFKLGMFGFNQWTNRMGPFSDQQLFDMQVSMMLRSNYVAVYGKEYTESMETLIGVAKLNIPRIDYRSL